MRILARYLTFRGIRIIAGRELLIYKWTLYIKISAGYIPPYTIEKNHFIAIQKRNLLLSKEDYPNQLT